MTPPSIHNIPRPGMSRPYAAPRPNMLQQMKHRRSRPNNVSQYKNPLDPFCTMHERWTQPSQCHSMTLQRNKPRRLKKCRPTHVARGAPTCVGYLFSPVQLFCILAEQRLFCCNPRGRGSGRRQRVADVVSRFGGDSM
jgi:hypothetical protein